MRRRAFLASGLSATATALAGCSGILGGGLQRTNGLLRPPNDRWKPTTRGIPRRQRCLRRVDPGILRGEPGRDRGEGLGRHPVVLGLQSRRTGWRAGALLRLRRQRIQLGGKNQRRIATTNACHGSDGAVLLGERADAPGDGIRIGWGFQDNLLGFALTFNLEGGPTGGVHVQTNGQSGTTDKGLLVLGEGWFKYGFTDIDWDGEQATAYIEDTAGETLIEQDVTFSKLDS